jgi:hypothetical protein
MLKLENEGHTSGLSRELGISVQIGAGHVGRESLITVLGMTDEGARG